MLGPEELAVLLQMSQGVDLSQVDLDGDGSVTLEELTTATSNARSTMPQGEA